jgi:two-component system chemotaxis response regulator CheB
MVKRDIIVIGASAGGLPALRTLFGKLPKDLKASVFVVWHISPNHRSILPGVLSRAGKLPAAHAVDGEPIRPGRIYVAPPAYHLVLEVDRVRLTKGPKENRFRPAVDTLFRSAAYAFGPRVIGIILTGALDDDSAGLWSIEDRGGIAIVQDPEEAENPSMPASAKQHVEIDYCIPIAQIAETVINLIGSQAAETGESPASKSLEIETRIAFGDNPLAEGIMTLGEASTFTCPECHGVLIEITNGKLNWFRCHTGHAFSINSLLAGLAESTENALWSAVRAIDENIMLLNHMAQHAQKAEKFDLAKMLTRKSEESKQQGDLLRKATFAQDIVNSEQFDEKKSKIEGRECS